MSTTHPNPLARRGRLGLGAAVTAVIGITTAYTFEVDVERAAARLIAERIERSVEQHADHRSRFDVDAVTTAIDTVFASGTQRLAAQNAAVWSSDASSG